jgi:hypothetical protein
MARWETPVGAGGRNRADRTRFAAGLQWSALGTAAVSVGLLWAPWVRTGSTTRHSFRVFRALQALGLEQLTPLRVFWFLLPVLFGLVALLVVVRRLTAAAFSLAVLSAVVAAAAWAVRSSGTAAWGARLALLSGLVGIAVSSLVLVRRVVKGFGPRSARREADQGGSHVNQ